jgi:hypothetical protein
MDRSRPADKRADRIRSRRESMPSFGARGQLNQPPSVRFNYLGSSTRASADARPFPEASQIGSSSCVFLGSDK